MPKLIRKHEHNEEELVLNKSAIPFYPILKKMPWPAQMFIILLAMGGTVTVAGYSFSVSKETKAAAASEADRRERDNRILDRRLEWEKMRDSVGKHEREIDALKTNITDLTVDTRSTKIIVENIRDDLRSLATAIRERQRTGR